MLEQRGVVQHRLSRRAEAAHPPSGWRAHRWPMAVVIAGTIVRLPQLASSLAGDHAFRQTQTAFGIREFARHGVNLMHGPLPLFGTAQDAPLEFPLFQALARILMHFGLESSTAGRTTGLAAFQATAVLWWLILRRWRGPALATTTLAMFEVLPFGLHWGAACLIDYFSIALGLVMVLGFDMYLRSERRSRWFGLSACVVGASGLFVVKVTSVPGMGILLIVSAVLAGLDLGWRAIRTRVAIGLVVGPGLGLVMLTLWTRHADQIKGRYAATQFIVSGNMTGWNFGGSRLSPREWESIGLWAGGSIVGPLCLIVVAGVTLGLAQGGPRSRILTVGLLSSTLAPMLIFFNLFAVHSYYEIEVYPYLVAIGATGVVTLYQIARRRSSVHLVLPLVLVLLWFGSTALSAMGRHDLDQFFNEQPMPPQVTELRAITSPGTRIIAVGCDWNPQIFFFADRTGLMLREATPDIAPEIWRQNRIQDYHFLVTCDQTIDPLRFLPRGTGLTATTKPHVFIVVPPPTT